MKCLWESFGTQTAVVIFLALIVIGEGCENGLNSTSTQRTVIFDSGRGTGQYDSMTYLTYESRLRLVPTSDMTVAAIRPQMWFCNGSCGFAAFIMDEHGRPLASEAGLVDGTGSMTPTFLDRHLDSALTLKSGTTYEVRMSVWTTKSVGIYTTGSRSGGTVGQATFATVLAKSENTDHLDRGAIAFQLLQ